MTGNGTSTKITGTKMSSEATPPPLFVAATRARNSLEITWHGSPSPFLAR